MFHLALVVKTLLPIQETQLCSLGWEDPLKEEMAIHAGILAWKVPWTEEPGGLQSTGSHRVGQTERLQFRAVQFLALCYMHEESHT